MTNLPDDVARDCVDQAMKELGLEETSGRAFALAHRAATIAASARYGELVEALTDIRNLVLCPVGPSPTIDELQAIASAALLSTIGEPNPDSGGV